MVAYIAAVQVKKHQNAIYILEIRIQTNFDEIFVYWLVSENTLPILKIQLYQSLILLKRIKKDQQLLVLQICLSEFQAY